MDIFWDKFAREDYLHWINTDNKALKKINYLIKECQCTPF
ncbi:type II toxin-antitoxin system YoeB family toxin [Mangrovibacterium marinum]